MSTSLTLAPFSQWAQSSSERAFYRHFQRYLRPARAQARLSRPACITRSRDLCMTQGMTHVSACFK